MNSPFPQVTESPDKKIENNDNKELALKGRFVTSSAFLLFLHSQSLIKLNKLPLIGMTFEDTASKTITIILLMVLLYALYKYWVYERVSDLSTSMDIYSDKVKCKLLEWYFTRLYKNAHAYALSYGSLVGFKFFKRSYDINNPINVSRPPSGKRQYCSIYNVKKWAYNFHTETEMNHERIKFSDTHGLLWEIQVTSRVHSLHEVTKTISRYDVVNNFRYSFKNYLRITKLCNIVAYFTLPDFIERTAPYVFAWLSIISSVFMLLNCK